jgi:hypothetical protein
MPVFPLGVFPSPLPLPLAASLSNMNDTALYSWYGFRIIGESSYEAGINGFDYTVAIHLHIPVCRFILVLTVDQHSVKVVSPAPT